MKDLLKIKQQLDQYRSQNQPFITVNNSEWYTLFRDEIRNSIAIEGIFTNRNELLAVLEHGRRTSDQKSAAILGYFEAANTLYEYANNLYRTGEFSVRLSDLKQIHTLLMRYEYQLETFTGILGDFRREDVAVTHSLFTPLNHTYIPEVLPVFVQWLNEQVRNPQIDMLKFVSACHVLFETIHPFRDGNGRVGRILLSYLLIGNGLVNITIKGTTKEDRDKYYHALEVGDDRIEKLMRAVESGKKLNTDLIDATIAQSDLEPLKMLLSKCVGHSFEMIEKGMKTADSDAMISLRDAGKFFNYSQDYLRQLINRKKLLAIKHGKLWFVKVRDIEAYMKRKPSRETLIPK